MLRVRAQPVSVYGYSAEMLASHLAAMAAAAPQAAAASPPAFGLLERAVQVTSQVGLAGEAGWHKRVRSKRG